MNSADFRQRAADQLRRAVTRQAFDEVEAAVANYRREVEAAIAAWHPGEPPPVDIVREAMDLTRWALRMVRASRARTNHKLEQVSAVLRYRFTATPRPQWKLEG